MNSILLIVLIGVSIGELILTIIRIKQLKKTRQRLEENNAKIVRLNNLLRQIGLKDEEN